MVFNHLSSQRVMKELIKAIHAHLAAEVQASHTALVHEQGSGSLGVA
jgi:hypothetical protein